MESFLGGRMISLLSFPGNPSWDAIYMLRTKALRSALLLLSFSMLLWLIKK